MVKQSRKSELADLASGTAIVTEHLRQLFQHGILTVNRRSAGRSLYNYWRETPSRLSETHRRDLFSSTLGIAGGSEGGTVNREFNDLWLRFVSNVAIYKRENEPTRHEAATS